jgi:hypothetical protein
VLSSARISRVKVPGGLGAAAEAGGLAGGGLASGGVGGLLAEPATDVVGTAAEDAGSVCVGVVVAEIGAGDDFSAGRVAAVGADAGEETGAGD